MGRSVGMDMSPGLLNLKFFIVPWQPPAASADHHHTGNFVPLGQHPDVDILEHDAVKFYQYPVADSAG